MTNRLNSSTYDAAGNLTHWNAAVYEYDAFNQMVRMTSGAQDWTYVYTAGDERLWSYDFTKQEASRWTLRDLSGQVLREYLNDGGTWTVGTDYIHRGGQLLAAETRLGRRHFHLDHLGTPRLISRARWDTRRHTTPTTPSAKRRHPSVSGRRCHHSIILFRSFGAVV